VSAAMATPMPIPCFAAPDIDFRSLRHPVTQRFKCGGIDRTVAGDESRGHDSQRAVVHERALLTNNVIFSGGVTATNFTGNGYGLSNVPATSLTGTIPDARAVRERGVAKPIPT